ncbi:MAG: type II secretion system protein [Lachnospiraceae bacterium]|nr:type II secretion system protein [Lachnospiraceae bacterium]
MKKSMNNKGFSLVELIIVIAIMAVLVGLLAPQYLKYVNNSKVSTDISNAQEVATVFNVGFADSKVSSGTYSTVPSGLTMAAFPSSKLDASYAWVVTVNDNGVSQITLNGQAIYPDPKVSGGYYTTNYK